MGDPNPNNARPIPISIPPGFQFYPTEEQLLCYYLRNKNNHLDVSFPSVSDVNYLHLGLDMVKEIDLYDYDPIDLRDVACFRYGRGGRRKHWYCFTAKTSTERVKRKAKGGFWRRKVRARDILGGREGQLLGKRRTFVFYRRSLSVTMKTGWVLYEYSLVDSLKDPFTLCRVFFKSHPGNKIAARRITDMDVPYKHYRGALGSGIGEALAHADASVGTDYDIQGLPMKRTSGPCDTILAQPASGDGFQLPMTISQPYQLVESSNGIVSSSNHSTICVSTMTNQQICNSVILEGDFIELNDLITPLPDVDA